MRVLRAYRFQYFLAVPVLAKTVFSNTRAASIDQRGVKNAGLSNIEVAGSTDVSFQG